MRLASGPARCAATADLCSGPVQISVLARYRRSAPAERTSRLGALVAHATSWEAHPGTRPGPAAGPRPQTSSSSSPSHTPAELHAAAGASGALPPLPDGVVEHLDALGISPASIDPQLRSLESFAAHAEPSLSTLATLNSRQRVATLVNGHPELLCVPLEGWLSFLTAYGVTRRDFFRLLSHNPDLFTRGSLFNAGSVIAYLQSLGLSPRDVSSTIIPRCSGLLLLDLWGQLAPAVEFLRSELELDAPGLKALLCRCPAALCQDPGSQLAPRLEALAAAGFSRREACGLVRHNSALLIGDVAGTLQARLSFLTVHCGFSGPQARELMTACPEVLSLSVANLGRKWRFLVERMHCGTQAVLAYPRYWSKSLLLDIGPRFSYVRERQLLPLAGAPCTLASSSGSSSSGSGHAGSGSSTSSGSSSNGSGGAGGSLACGLEGACEVDLRVLLDADDIAFVAAVWRAAGGGGGDDRGGGGGGGSGAAATRGAAAAAAEADAGALEMSALQLAADFGDLPGSWAGASGAERASRAPQMQEEEEAGVEAGAEAGMGEGEGEGERWVGPGPDDYERFRAAWLETEGVRWSGVNAVGSAGAGGVAGSW